MIDMQMPKEKIYGAIAFLIVASLIVLMLFVELSRATDFTLPDNLTSMTANAELTIINPLPYAAVNQLCQLNGAEAGIPIFNQVIGYRRAIMQIKNEWCG